MIACSPCDKYGRDKVYDREREIRWWRKPERWKPYGNIPEEGKSAPF